MHTVGAGVCNIITFPIIGKMCAFWTTRAVCKVRGLTLLLRVGTLWRCGDGLFSEVPPLASDALLTTLHPFLKNVLQTVDHFEISGLGASFSRLEKPRNRTGRYRDCMAEVLMGFHRSRLSASIATFQWRNADAPLRLIRHPKKGSFKRNVTPFSKSGWSVVRCVSLAKGGISKRDRHRTSIKFRLGVIRRVQELSNVPRRCKHSTVTIK
jgi:hypothetical protein